MDGTKHNESERYYTTDIAVAPVAPVSTTPGTPGEYKFYEGLRDKSDFSDIDTKELMIIDDRFRVTQKNKISYDIAFFMRRYAIIFEVIEEERLVAHVNGKLTWLDLFDSEEFEAPDENAIQKYLRNTTESPYLRNNFDEVERFSRSVDEKFEDFLNDEDLREDLLVLDKKRKCWSCGDRDSELFVCNQCRRAKYCDPLCQDEDWSKYSQWCGEVRKQMEKEREGESREEREVRKTKQKWVKTRMNEAVRKEIARRNHMATLFENACE